MILRRFLDHIRNQNWHLVIFEMAIVVVGVFLGLQADNWNQARLEAAQEKATVAQLHAEFEHYGQLISGIAGTYSDWMSDVDRLLKIIDSGDEAPQETLNGLMNSVFSVGIVPLPPTTLRDLLDQNGISELGNEDLKCLLRGFDDSLHFNRTAFELTTQQNVSHSAQLRGYARIVLSTDTQSGSGFHFRYVDIDGIRQNPAAIGALEAFFAQHQVLKASLGGLNTWTQTILLELNDPDGHVWRTGNICPVPEATVQGPEDVAGS